MYRFLACLLTLCLFQDIIAYCCYRDPLTIPSCGCLDVITCNPCNCGNTMPSCYQDTSVCYGPMIVSSCGCSDASSATSSCNCGVPMSPCNQDTFCCGPMRISSCGCSDASATTSTCNCGVPMSPCFRDTSNVCLKCENKPSPVCSCLQSIEGCGNCGGECGCGCEKTFIYFPEVEYPTVALDVKPFRYGTCYCV